MYFKTASNVEQTRSYLIDFVAQVSGEINNQWPPEWHQTWVFTLVKSLNTQMVKLIVFMRTSLHFRNVFIWRSQNDRFNGSPGLQIYIY